MIAVEFLAPGRLWFLVIVALMAAAYVAMQFTRRKHVVTFTNIDLLDQLAPSKPGWRRHVVAGSYLAAAVAGVFALAQPAERSLQQTESGGQIELVFDVSLSMEATDIDPNRLDAAKKAALDFVDQVDNNIEVGLISFNGNVSARVAPTLNHAQVNDAIEGLELGEGTAIGDALAVASDIIGPPTQDKPDEPAGAIVLLTDGETTQGDLTTAAGAEVAAANKIPVYGIAFGTLDGTVSDPNTGEVIPVPVNYDELGNVAEVTGGEFFEAPTADALEQAYAEISDNLNAGVGDPIEVVTEQTWKYVAVALVLAAIGWLVGLWWLRGLL
ncbi:MAG: VWA domain-containing protein [Ilumatobacteraceae bacterium]